jgi:hypothetical protein
MSRNNGTKTRGKPFEPGNPGRPKGARHKATIAAEALLEGEAEALTRKAVEKALEGDTTALRLCLERLVPPRKDRLVTFTVPPIAGPADALRVMGEIVAAVSAGELTAVEAAGVQGVVQNYMNAWKATDLERRLTDLEGRMGPK